MHDYCRSCRSFHRHGKHLPSFLVQQVEDIGSKFPTIDEVHADNPEEAAEKWAEQDDYDSAEYDILRGDDAEVVVTAPDGTKTRWKVMGESEPTYYARQIEEGTESEQDGEGAERVSCLCCAREGDPWGEEGCHCSCHRGGTDDE